MLCFTTLQCLPIRPEGGVFLRRVRFKRSILFFALETTILGWRKSLMKPIAALFLAGRDY